MRPRDIFKSGLCRKHDCKGRFFYACSFAQKRRPVIPKYTNPDGLSTLNKHIELILGVTKTGLNIIDSDYNIVYVDPKSRKVYGDPKGKKCYKYFTAKNQRCPACGIEGALKTKKPLVTEKIFANKKNRQLQVTTIPFQNERGEWLVAEVNTDITKRKHSEEELAKYRDHLEDVVRERTTALVESEERFKTIFKGATDGMVLADAISRRFCMCNKAICRMLGYTEEEMCKMGVSDIHPKDELEHAVEVFASQANGTLGLAADMRVKRKDGSIFYADISTSIIYLKGKKYLMGSFRDITERKSTEAALVISEASYRSIFELASDAIMIRDMNTYKTIDANRAACEMFCYPKEEMIGRYISDFMTNEPHYRWEDAKHFYEKATAGEPQLFEWLAVDKAGRSFWVEATVKRAVIGNKYRLISILRDITERKRLDSMKENFMNSVSHELRTPLAAIKEGVSIILEEIKGGIGRENKTILSVVKKNVDRLNRLINDVLDFQRLESGNAIFRFRPHDINSVITECYNTMSAVARGKNLKLVMNLDKEIPKLLFDRDKILQVLINLLNNAVKFTKKGSITISTVIEGDAVKVSVADTGVGIRPEALKRLFKKFGQIEDKVEMNIGGTGLGLAISREIIERHRGKIWAESIWCKGSVFSFTLPLRKKVRHEKSDSGSRG